jgi:hypothetical protein
MQTASTFLFRCVREQRERSRVGRRGSRRSLPVCTSANCGIFITTVLTSGLMCARTAQWVVLRRFDGREKWQKLNECPTRKWVNDQAYLLPSLHHRANRVGDRVSVQGFEIVQWRAASTERYVIEIRLGTSRETARNI